MDISLEEFKAAQQRISGLKYDTPLYVSSTFSNMTKGTVYLKCENIQKTGSFKIRGAGNAIGKMLEEGVLTAVIAPSAGNHAQGVAYCAEKLGIKSTIVMPQKASIAKVQATKGYGADVVLYGNDYDDAYEKATEICNTTGAKMIHPYDDINVITGQGTLGLEILKELPDADIVVVPAGGGGLLAGVSCAIKKVAPNVKVYGVQAENANAIFKSFEKKERVCTKSAKTVADGIAVNNPGEKTISLINRYVDNMVTVNDNEIASAVLLLMERTKQVVEGAGAASVAAVLDGKIDVKGKKVVCVLSGGNIDVNTIGGIIERALSVRSRRLELYLFLEDDMESFLTLSKKISDMGASIIAFSRDKISSTLNNNESRIYILCEVGGEEHKQKVIEKLKKDYEIVLTDKDFSEYYKKYVE